MKRLFGLIFILIFLFAFGTGCTSSAKYVPSHALKDPAEGLSLPDSKEMAKENIKVVTTLKALMDPGLFTEIMGGGGVWPTLALTKDQRIIKGYAYLSTLNWWGDFLLELIFPCTKEELDRSKILYFNRDAGWVYTLVGEEVKYDPKKFDKKEKYKREVFREYGMTPRELDLFWGKYLTAKGVNTPNVSCLKEIDLASPEWEKHLAEKMPHKYKMWDGKIRRGHFPLKQFKREASLEPGFSPGKRLLKNAVLPIGPADFFVSAGLSLVIAAIQAGVNDDYEGYYARAKTLRGNLAPSFRDMSRMYKELLRKRDRKRQ